MGHLAGLHLPPNRRPIRASYSASGARRAVDWARRETVRLKLRVMVKTLLKRHEYAHDRQEEATETVLRQAEALSAEWVSA